MKVYLIVLFSALLAVNVDAQIKCYQCKESATAACGPTLIIDSTLTEAQSDIKKVTCDAGQACVTFKNKYDGGKIMRDCSSNLWVPTTGTYDPAVGEDCVKDRYSLELFCFCTKELCNGNNTANSTIFAINECLSNPCLNNATCVDMYNQYQCTCAGNYSGARCETCKPGYTGLKCETQIQGKPCDSAPCLNGAACVDYMATFNYACTCTNGFIGRNCQTDFDECASNPCKNGAVCLNTPGAFKCDCKIGWSGALCDTDVDECATNTTNKCVAEQGVCKNTLGSYTCTCNAGYTGIYCETNINECASTPCKNGSCVDQVASFKCNCNAGYTGVLCDAMTDLCATTSPCDSNGTSSCIPSLNSFKCQCKQGYTGATCDTAMDVCDTLPCLHGGNCTKSTYPLYTCVCAAGYTGLNCESDINECASSPCKNGVCLNQLAKYSCTCNPGWTGALCDTDADECASNPCYADGVNTALGTNGCTNLANAFKCNCKQGYTGTLCEIDINECASNPCKNGGTCRDQLGKYICLCDQVNYSGLRCEIPVYHCSVDQPDPCNSNGDCSGGVGTQPIVCTCFDGFTGTRCENKISPCNSNPCLNGGACSEAATGGYTCSCPPSYTGLNCQTNISPCKVNNVNCNFGVCVDTPNGDFVCDCNDGYTGRFCTEKYFTCTEQGTFPDPAYCENYINCVDSGNGVFTTDIITCPKLSIYQLLFDPVKKVCVLPGKHPNPSCYTP